MISGFAVRSRKWFHAGSLTVIAWLLRAFSFVLPYRIGVWAGGLIGRIAYYLFPRERRRAHEHLALSVRGTEAAWIRRTALRNFDHLGKSLLEVLLMTPGRLARIVEFRGAERFADALAHGRGAVLVTGHIGNWELMGNAIASRFPLSAVAAPLKPAAVNDLIVGLRARLGFRTILRGRPGAAKEIIKVFRENRIIAVLIDQDTDVDGAFVDFMGRAAWTPTAAAQMALKFDAPVLFGHIHRGANDRHTVTIEGPVSLSRSGDRERDIVENTRLLTKKLEECILRDPEQWVWMHRRWRRQP